MPSVVIMSLYVEGSPGTDKSVHRNKKLQINYSLLDYFPKIGYTIAVPDIKRLSE